MFTPLSISCEGSFSLINHWNSFQLMASGANTNASTTLLLLDLFCTYTHRPRTAWKTCHKANKFSCETLCTSCNNLVYETLQVQFCLPQFRLQASIKRMYARNTRPFPNGMPPSQLRTNWVGIKRRTGSWLSAGCLQLAVVRYICT